MKVFLVKLPKMCYTETAPQLNMNLKTWLQLWQGVSFFPCFRILETVVAQHIGILSAGVPNVERPYFLPANYLIRRRKRKWNKTNRKSSVICMRSVRRCLSLPKTTRKMPNRNGRRSTIWKTNNGIRNMKKSRIRKKVRGYVISKKEELERSHGATAHGARA